MPKDPVPTAFKETDPDPDVAVEKEHVETPSGEMLIILVRKLHGCYKRLNQLIVSGCIALLAAKVRFTDS